MDYLLGMERVAMWAQFSITAALACLGWAASVGEYPKTRLLIALAIGFGGNWLVMFCYVLVRYGWHAARSMRLYGNE